MNTTAGKSNVKMPEEEMCYFNVSIVIQQNKICTQ